MQEVVRAVHGDEVEMFFQRIGLLEDLNEGKIICHSCKTVISPENFGFVTKKNGDLLFSCRNSDCHSSVTELILP